MIRIKYVEGIPCIVLDEEIDKEFSKFQDWKEKNNFMFFQNSNDLKNLKDVLNELKKRFDDDNNNKEK